MVNTDQSSGSDANEKKENRLTCFTETICTISAIAIDQVAYTRSQGKLSIAGESNGTVMTRILDICPAVTLLSVDSRLKVDVVETIGRRVGKCLTSLDWTNHHDDTGMSLLRYCSPLLVKFSFFGSFSYDLLDLLCANCPGLQSFSLHSRISHQMLVTTVDRLCQSCPMLNEVTVKGITGLTVDIFKPLVTRNICLERLVLWSGILCQEDASELRQLAKLHQLLPVLDVVIKDFDEMEDDYSHISEEE